MKKRKLTIRELKCRELGNDCNWKATGDTDDEILKKAAQHGQQEHGRKEFDEDIQAGMRSKIRDVKSSQIRGDKHP